MAKIICVEDDEGIRELICCALKTGGYEVQRLKRFTRRLSCLI